MYCFTFITGNRRRAHQTTTHHAYTHAFVHGQSIITVRLADITPQGRWIWSSAVSYRNASVGIDLKERGGGRSAAEMFEILPRDWNLKPIFTQKMSVCRHELGGRSTTNPRQFRPWEMLYNRPINLQAKIYHRRRSCCIKTFGVSTNKILSNLLRICPLRLMVIECHYPQ